MCKKGLLLAVSDEGVAAPDLLDLRAAYDTIHHTTETLEQHMHVASNALKCFAMVSHVLKIKYNYHDLLTFLDNAIFCFIERITNKLVLNVKIQEVS